MTWLRLDDRFDEHVKIIGLADRAFRVHISGLLYAARNSTGGRVPEAALARLGATRQIAGQLVAAVLWHVEEGGYRINDFDEYNPPSTGAERQKRYRDRHRNSGGDVTPNATRDDGVTASRVAAHTRPVPYPSPKPSAVDKEDIAAGDTEGSQHQVIDFPHLRSIQ